MNYGFIPKTLAEDHDPLDVLVLCSETLAPLVEVECYPIGVVRMTDNEQMDEKIMAIPFKDPVYNSDKNMPELPSHLVNEVSHFFDVYKTLEHSATSVKEACDRDEALRIVASSIGHYRELFT
jgi:inorganic pyrophosphatase